MNPIALIEATGIVRSSVQGALATDMHGVQSRDLARELTGAKDRLNAENRSSSTRSPEGTWDERRRRRNHSPQR